MSGDILSTEELSKRWNLHPSTIAQKWRSGKMPPPFNDDQKRAFRWHSTVIDAYERGEWTPTRRAS